MLLYLIHFDQPVSGKSHYCGSCEDDQLPTRLRRHQCGTGSNLTRRAHLQQTGFSLAMVKQIPDRSHEKQWKKAKRYRADCSICANGGLTPDLFPDCLHFEPVAQNGKHSLNADRGFSVGFD